MTDVTVPKLNNNDESYILLEWLFGDGQSVEPGDAIAVVETSKAAQDLICDDGGVLHRFTSEKAECRPGDVIGRMFASEPDRQRYLADQQAGPTTADGVELVMTDSARVLAAQHDIPADRLRALGKTVIRRADVERIMGGTVGDEPAGPASRELTLSRRQQAIAAVVSESHRTVPAAFTLLKLDVGGALTLARSLADRVGAPVGLPELLVKTVAGLHGQFPLFFARPADQVRVEPFEAAHVGVTIDVGTGLFVPVVRDAGQRSVAEIAEILMDFRIRGLRNTLLEQDFADAGIVVSLNNDDAVVFARPIVFPGHTCMVSLGGVLEELALDSAGNVVVRQVSHVGLAYDHRVLNGRDAVLFLQQIRARLESPEQFSPEQADAG